MVREWYGGASGWLGRGRSAYNLRLPPEAPGFKGLRLTAGRGPSNGFWFMVWEDWAEILPANRGRAMLNWGRHNAQCLPLWKQSGPMLSAGCAHVGPSRTHVEPSCAHFGLTLRQVGPMLSHVGPILGLCWAKLGLCGAMLGSSWAHVGPMLGLCWPMLGLGWPIWALLGAMLGPCLGHLWNDLKIPIFAPRAPSWSQKPRKKKKRCFFNIAKMKYGGASGVGRQQGGQRL